MAWNAAIHSARAVIETCKQRLIGEQKYASSVAVRNLDHAILSITRKHD